MKKDGYVWHPNTQMSEWERFDNIVSAKGMWLFDEHGNKMLDGVASMWCNVWGHSKKEILDIIIKQAKTLQHSSLFNLTNEPVEKLAKKLVQISPNMSRVFYSDNGSTAMEIAFKIALQYWQNIGIKNKTTIVALENGYHGDTFGSMSVGYVEQFFSKFKRQLFNVVRNPVPNKYRLPQNYKLDEYQKYCLAKIEKLFLHDDTIAAFVMESGAQVAGGVIIYPQDFQQEISKLCKKYEVLLVLDEIATGLGRLGSLVEYVAQKSAPDIVSYGKMLTGGYMTLAATLTTKKIYDSFLGNFEDMKQLSHGHTFTGNPLAASVANENLALYEKNRLIDRIKKTSKIFTNRAKEIKSLDVVGDVRFKGMLMGIELVKDQEKKIPLSAKKSINKLVFEEGKKHKIYLRTLGNIVMIVPPLAISQKELNFLFDATISTIKGISKNALF